MSTRTLSSKTVVVGMSGGVDSSVAAGLLRDQGYNVIGITMKTYDFEGVGGNVDNESSCCGLSAVNDARRAAATLGIPHYVVDFRGSFTTHVIDNFVEEYMKGRTPNPCIICNRELKWGEMLKKADALSAEYIATGHYARVRTDELTQRIVLSRGKFAEKDQSYALWAIPQHALRRTLFPLGELTKPEVREMASRFGLKNAQKQESFEICFIPDDRYDRFLQERNPELARTVANGQIIMDGKVVGTHRGYPFYTVGQRKGLGAFAKKVYVTGIDSVKNVVYVGTDTDLHERSLIASRCNWVGIERPEKAIDVTAKIRYKDEPTDAVIEPLVDGCVRVTFLKAKRAITPGQSVVFYRGDDVLGGGIIEGRDS